MDDIKINKEELRKKYLEVRKDLPHKEEKSKTIITKIIKTKEYQEARVIALYKSLSSEVNLDDLINYAIEHNKKIVLPKVEGSDLFFYVIGIDEELVKSNFGILEPISNQEKLVDKKQIDLVIVPGICFDKERNRLGFGKGFHDRYLAKSNVYKIGVGFNCQLLTDDILPVNQFDIKMDKVITEEKEY